MLHQPDVNVDKIMKLADFLDDLSPERFSMKTFGQWEEPRCICGWLLHNEGHFRKDSIYLAADILGIKYPMARRLFGANTPYTNKEAASVLRHIAVTGDMP
jgi:hypothetical protein